jgi:integrase
MGNIKYYLNKGKGTEKNRPIMISYTFNGQRLFFYSGLRIAENEFDQYGKYPAKPKCIDRVYINNRLLLIRNTIGEIENEALAGGKQLTPDLFRTALNERLKSRPKFEAKPEARVTLKQYFDIYIKELPNRVNRKGHKLSKSMPVKYGTIKNLFNDFCEHEGREYDFQDMNEAFYKRFSAYMTNEKKYAVNTYGRAFKFLKTILNEASKPDDNGRRYNEFNDFKSFATGISEESDSIYLTETELQAIYKLDLSDKPGLDRVRDLFLIGCYTGLRFSDYTTISPDDIKGERLRVMEQKTKGKVVIPISPTAKAILQKYNFSLPKAISNQKFNEALKKIADKAKINETVVTNITKGGETLTTSQAKYKLVTSHVARRSFATNSVKRGISPVLIMAITGHKTEKEFWKYVKVTNEEKADLYEKEMNW